MKLDDPLPRAFAADPALRLVDAIDLPIGRWDRDTRLVFCNGPYLRWAGRLREELIGRTLTELYGAAAWAAAEAAFGAAFNGSTVSYERKVTHQGAAGRWSRVQVCPDRNAAGEVEAVYTIAFDIHQDVLEREQLLEARQRLARFTEHIPYPLTYVDQAYRLRFVNLAYQRVVGMPATALLGRPIGEVRGAQRWAEHKPYFDRALAGETVHYTRLVDDLPQGSRWLRTSYVPDLDDANRVQGAYTVTIDVHDLTEAQRRAARSAERDGLTDVLSRRAMMQRIDTATLDSDARPVALFFLDLDGFKPLNDAHGHAAGDALLVALGHALQQAVRGEDAVGRFGGDEFLVLAAVRDEAGAEAMALHLLAAVRDCAARSAGAAEVTASIGYALAPRDAQHPLRLLQLADAAMYDAKRAGKNCARRAAR